MDKRIVDFITGLRAAGVRISVAESMDALRAIEQAGVTEREFFRAALQASLVKEPQDVPTFQKLFPMYFRGGDPPPPMMQPGAGGQLSEDEQRMLEQMLQQMLATMTPEQIARLFEAMMRGQRPSNQAMQAMMEGVSPPSSSNPMHQEWMARRAMRELEFNRLERALRELLEQLREAGMSEQALREIEQAARQNQQALAQQIAEQVGQQMIEQQGAGQGESRNPRRMNELLDRPFEYLTQEDTDDLRGLVARLAARLRSRMALRHRRGKTGTLDAKSTIRTNLRFGGVPMIVRHKRRHLKPRLVVLVDRSRSTENVVRFLLQLLYTLQDQVSQTRSFCFIDTLHDVSTYFAEARPEHAVDLVMEHVYPRRSYSTDLGNSLHVLMRDYCSCIDHRTTVIILGDARNNENDPNLRAFGELKKRARKVVWFNPEPPHMWGCYDPGSLSSDMLKYAPMCDAVHYVSNMRQLADAVDSLFVRR